MPKQTELQKELNKHTMAYVAHTVEEMKRLRHWFAGFEAAGGKLPVCVQNMDCVWKAHVLLEEYADLMKKYGSSNNRD